MDAETIIHALDPQASCEHRTDGYWATVPNLDTRAMANLMLGNDVRLVTLTAMPDASGGHRVMYHWDADGALINIATTVQTSIATIADILPAADWVEREIRDYYALEFEGRAETPTLMLRDGDEPGLFSRTCKLGREADPAETAHEAAAVEPEGV